MLTDTSWLETAAATSRQLLVAAIWGAGFVLALRRRPAAGARPAAVGFELLAAVRLGSLFVLLVSDDSTTFDSFHMISFDFGMTIYIYPGQASAAGDAIACLIEVTGAALVIAGLFRAWRDSAREASHLRQNRGVRISKARGGTT